MWAEVGSVEIFRQERGSNSPAGAVMIAVGLCEEEKGSEELLLLGRRKDVRNKCVFRRKL